MTKLEKAKEIITEHFKDADCGIFNSRNFVGDPMLTIYDDGELNIDICYYWSYFEVFGLTENDFNLLKKYYEELKERKEDAETYF
jgi:hypothetical protein